MSDTHINSLCERTMNVCIDAASMLSILEAAICDTEPADVPDPSHARVLLELVRNRLLDAGEEIAKSKSIWAGGGES